MSDGPWGAAFDFIDRFLNNYAIWLWLLVFFCLLWLAGWLDYVSYQTSIVDLENTSRVSALLVFCLLMNAINAQVYIYAFIRETLIVLINIISYIHKSFSRSKAHAKQNFERIISSNCRERIWITWFIFEWEPLHRFEIFELVNSKINYTEYGRDKHYYSYNSFSAFIIMFKHKIFYTSPEKAFRFWYVTYAEREFSTRIYPTFNLFNELQDLLNRRPELRSDILDLADRVKGKQMTELEKLERELEWYSDLNKPAPDPVEYERRRKFVEPQQAKDGAKP